jgi:lipid-A-disaccharide synthase
MKNPRTIMLVAGEPSGDAMGAELVRALGARLPGTRMPRFIGAGGALMAEAGVTLAFDLTKQSVIGLSDVIKKLWVFRRLLLELIELAARERPDVIVLVDFGAFNLRLAHALQKRIASIPGWRPKIVKYVSPQVWASRPGRAAKMAKDVDLLLCLFPFEKEWYARRVPELKVVCVGHPLFDRHSGEARPEPTADRPTVVLLPGSRNAELRRHLPPMFGAVNLIRSRRPEVRFVMVLPSESLLDLARSYGLTDSLGIAVQIGGLSEALRSAWLAIACTGTVTLECAYYLVPTVALYKTSWSTFQIGKRIVNVRFLAMPNLLADEAVYPELIQNDATPDNIAQEAIKLLEDPTRCAMIRKRLEAIMATLGGPGTAGRAAEAILALE